MAKNYDRKDHLYQRAKEEGLRSRASYKLLELDKKYKLFRQGMTVLDLGCFPGGWLQIASKKVGKSGLVVGVDLVDVDQLEIEVAPVKIFKGDIYELETQAQLREATNSKVDLVLSDMSPSLSGIRFQDAARSAALVEIAHHIATELLVPEGCFVAKVFPGSECDEVFKVIQSSFRKANRVVLKSTRKTSKEIYLVAQGRKPS